MIKRFGKMTFKNMLSILLLSAAVVVLLEISIALPGIAALTENSIVRAAMVFSAAALSLVLLFAIPDKKKNSGEYSLLNNINTGIFVIDPTGKILFYNKFFISIFKKISNWLTIKNINEISTYNYFDFYLNPDEQRTLFNDSSRFPINSVLDIGSEIISAYAVPLYQNKSHDKRIMVTWDLITRERNQNRWEKVVEEQIENTSGELTTASGELMTSSFKVQEIAQDTSKQAQDVATFSRDVTELILKLSQAVNLSSSKINVIAENVDNSRQISETALTESRSTRRLVTDLSGMASNISRATQTIQEIMAQTHILALNANIEAVKAGTAGKGFAVIAKEVGNLAKQTASMSEEITLIVDQILDKIPLSVSSIETVESVVREMNSITVSIHDLMEEQTGMMLTMNDHMNEANENSEQITQRMDEVVNYSYSTLEQIEKSQNAGRDIESIAELFNLIVSRFGEERIVTPNDIYHMLITIQQLIDAWIEKELSQQLSQQALDLPIEQFKDKKPANVLKTAIANYQIMLNLNDLPPEAIPFPKGTVTPTQTYNFLCQLMEIVEKILTQKGYSNIQQIKIAKPVTGKTPNDAYAIAHRIHRKLKLIDSALQGGQLKTTSRLNTMEHC